MLKNLFLFIQLYIARVGWGCVEKLSDPDPVKKVWVRPDPDPQLWFISCWNENILAVQVHTLGTIPTNTVYVPTTTGTGTIMDSGSV